MTKPPISSMFELSEFPRGEPLTGDASLRRYSRLWKTDGGTAILVEYPTPIRDQLHRDLEVFSWCRQRGLRVPGILGRDLENGRALLEDFGPEDAEVTLDATPPQRRLKLVESMLTPLEVLAGCDPDELPPWNQPLDRSRMRWELAGFELWYVRHHRLTPPSSQLCRWLDELADEVGRHPRRVCHRDYHLNNLLIQPDGAIGIIDIQDILIGPDTYDVVSLVAERAATRLLDEKTRDSILEEWADRTDAGIGWRDRVAAVKAQRGLKVLGTFARFAVAGQRRYEPWLDGLAASLAAPLAALGAPGDVTAILLD